MDSGIIPATRRVSGWYTRYMPDPRDVVLSFAQYRNCGDGKQLAIIVSSPEGEPICKATVALENWETKPFYVAIKDWGENEGVYAALLRANVVHSAEERFPTGFVKAFICRLKGI